MAADKGHLDSMLIYANILYKGDWLKVNKREVAKYFKKAVDNGKIEAMKA